MRPRCIWSMYRSRSRLRSMTTTSASMPAAIHAAFMPAIPAPRTRTLAGRTPETPPMRIPRPPYSRSWRRAPTCGAMRPATSLIGARRGVRPSGSWTVSYATADTLRSTSAWVRSRPAARWRYVNRICPSRRCSYSSGIGSFTLRIMSASRQTSAAPATISAPLRSKRSCGMFDPVPAPSCSRTRWPAWVSSRTPSGVTATRYSLSFTSAGTPTITRTPFGRPAPRSRTPRAAPAGPA